MAQVDIINSNKEKKGSLEIDDSYLQEKVNKALLHQALRRQIVGTQHGTVDTKTRSEVARTSKKVFKQKGTGNARHGSRKSAPFVGGGRVFGPHQRDHAIAMPRKMRQLAYTEALKYHLQNGTLLIVDSIPLDEVKTKKGVSFLNGISFPKGLVILEQSIPSIEKSLRNIKGVVVAIAAQIKLYDLARHERVLCTEKSFSLLKERFFH